ncbi:MAG: PspC domain-containing protein [Chloroflexota bacterium]
MKRKLYRSCTDKKIGGVCGGLGNYLNIDSTLVRLFFVILALGEGIGVLVYIILWILMPAEPTTIEKGGVSQEGDLADQLRADADEFAGRARAVGEDLRQAVREPDPQIGLIVGAVLIALGGIFFLKNLQISWLWWFDLDVLWPLLVIAAGVALLVRRARGG